jgi:MFS superfamily sulfate permease-like transporter
MLSWQVGVRKGLYSCVLPMIAYALFGSSRQLIVGPDATTCAVIAAVVFPLSAGNPELHWQLTIIMTLMMGGWCLLASKFRLGALADRFLIPSLRVCLMALPGRLLSGN